MSKAEDLAKELYPLLETDKIGNNPYISYNTEQLAKQEGFIAGYLKAEKDSELTWEDIKNLENLCIQKRVNDGLFDKEDYEEVLKRFKEIKK